MGFVEGTTHICYGDSDNRRRSKFNCRFYHNGKCCRPKRGDSLCIGSSQCGCYSPKKKDKQINNPLDKPINNKNSIVKTNYDPIPHSGVKQEANKTKKPLFIVKVETSKGMIYVKERIPEIIYTDIYSEALQMTGGAATETRKRIEKESKHKTSVALIT